MITNAPFSLQIVLFDFIIHFIVVLVGSIWIRNLCSLILNKSLNKSLF